MDYFERESTVINEEINTFLNKFNTAVIFLLQLATLDRQLEAEPRVKQIFIESNFKFN